MPRLRIGVLAASLLCQAGPAVAQTSLESPLQFEFVNPGAKSLALAGAFVGIADDATASFANPAGLGYLATPELSFEFRRSRTTTLALERGRLSGTATNIGVDVEPGPDFGETDTTHYGVRFLSAVYPHRSHKWVVAGYRHELARVHQRLDSDGVFQQDPTEPEPRRELPYEVERDLNITAYGVSGAYRLSRQLSLGAGLAVNTFDLVAVFRRFTIDDTYGPPVYEIGDVEVLLQEGTDVSLAPTVGLTFDTSKARLGLVYRHGASFSYEAQDGAEAPVRDVAFRVPHTLAVGVSVRPVASLLLSGEVTRITYSRLVRDFVIDQARETGQQASFFVNDGTEFHVAAQYAWSIQGRSPIRLRGGVWYDPDHSVQFRPARPAVSADDRLFDERFATALSTGTSVTHVTGGAGVTLSSRLDLNVGLDFAKRSRQFSTSVILHLGPVVR